MYKQNRKRIKNGNMKCIRNLPLHEKSNKERSSLESLYNRLERLLRKSPQQA